MPPRRRSRSPPRRDTHGRQDEPWRQAANNAARTNGKLVLDGAALPMSPAKVKDVCGLLLDKEHGNTKQLHHLTIQSCNVGKKGAEHIAEVLGRDRHNRRRNERLQELYLTSNSLGNAGVHALCVPLPFNGLLRTLGLFKNSVTAKGAEYLANGLQRNTALQTLHLGHNDLRAKGAIQLATSLRSCQLLKLTLESNDIGDEGARAFAEALMRKPTPSLQCLELRENNITDSGIVGAGSLRTCLMGTNTNRVLLKLDLRSNHFSENAKRQLRSVQDGAQDPAIEHLWMD